MKTLLRIAALLLWALLWLLAVTPPADAQAVTSSLEVVLNGRDTGEVLDFIPGPEGLQVSPADLRRLGIVTGRTGDLVALRGLPGLTYAVDERTQTIAVTADRRAMRAAALDARSEADDAVAQVSPGALINYDLTASAVGRQAEVAGVAEFRAFSRWGVVDSTVLVSGASVRRLDTSWTLADPRSMRRWTVGDVVGGGLAWTRPVRLVGVQLSSDFALRPDLVTFPTPTLKGSAAAASTVDVFVNGEQRYGAPVQGGAFDLAGVPVMAGDNRIAMTVTDASGRRSIQTLTFYASPSMLAPGLVAYSIEAGALRTGYGGGPGDGYGKGAAAATVRYGFSPAWTVEGHAEAARGLAVLGAGSVAVTRLGLVSLSAAASSGRGRSGAYAAVAYERIAGRINLSAGVEARLGDFSDLAALSGSAAPPLRLRLQAGTPIGARGTLGVAWVHDAASRLRAATDTLALTAARRLGPALNLSVNAYIGGGSRRSHALMLTLTSFFGGRTAAVGAVASDSGPVLQAQAGKAATGPADPVSWRLAAQASRQGSGAQVQAVAEIERRTAMGDWGAGVARQGGQTALRGTASGAVVLMDRRLFLARAIDQSFAVVHVDAPGVPVMADNRPVGLTRSDGRILATDLRPFQSSTVTLDPVAAPFELQLERVAARVKPLDRVGVVVRFAAQKADHAVVVLADPSGRPLPLGAQVSGAGEDAVVGYDGAAYLSGLGPDNRLTVRAPDGAVCTARFVFAAQPHAAGVPRIGPLICRPDGPA